MRSSTVTSRSGVLILGPNSVHSLLPTTLISQAESSLESHRIEDAVGLVDQRRKKIEGKEELRYVYQRIGFQCLSETLFEEAGNNFFAGDLDPRALISYYPDLHGSLFSEMDTLDIYAGVAEHMPPESSIDKISESPSPT
jgi:vacuolar protein sorting-associated protein 3